MLSKTTWKAKLSCWPAVSVLGALTLSVITSPPKAQALTFIYDDVIGQTQPDGTPPWLTVDINDLPTNRVSIQLTPNFTSSTGTIFADNITQLAFELLGTTIDNSIVPYTTSPPVKDEGKWSGNASAINRYPLGGTFNPGSCSYTGTPAYSCDDTSMGSGEDFDSITGQPAGAFDLFFDMPPPGDRARTGNIVTFIVQGPSNFSSASFGALNTAGNSTCAKVQTVGPNGEGSTEICGRVIPDGAKVPGPLPIAGAAFAFSWSRKLRCKVKMASPHYDSTSL